MRFIRRHSLLPASLLALAVVGSLASQVTAHAKQPTHVRAHPTMAATAFRLQVTGKPAAGTTFWVAYGPLAGRFGVVRLLPHGAGVYSAWNLLPEGRTTFVFLAGQGTVQTKAGAEPGGMPTTISLIGPTTAAAVGHMTVHWQAPLG